MAYSRISSAVVLSTSHLIRGTKSLLFPNMSNPSFPKKPSFRFASTNKEKELVLNKKNLVVRRKNNGRFGEWSYSVHCMYNCYFRQFFYRADAG